MALWPISTDLNDSIAGLKLAMGLITVADMLTCCGLGDALSATLSVAESEPTSLARKSTTITQLFRAPSVAGQRLSISKFPGLVPAPRLNETSLMVSGAFPAFFKLTFRFLAL